MVAGVVFEARVAARSAARDSLAAEVELAARLGAPAAAVTFHPSSATIEADRAAAVKVGESFADAWLAAALRRIAPAADAAR